MFPRFLFFLFLFLNINVYSQSLNWSQFIDSTLTFSSPRTVDLNMDGVLDIVIGSGIDSVYTNHGIIALDGVNGNLLWSVPTVNDIFTSSVFNDINGDSIPDIYIGGRDAQFYCINGLDGSIIWQFLAPPNLINNSDSGYYNFYSPQLLEDVNNDGVKDILVSNGGNHSLLPWITDRPPGHIMILDGFDGSIVAKAVVPDSNETYMSPIVSDLRNNNNYWIIYGTGGEYISGNLWIANLNDLLNNDLTNSTMLASGNSRGFIAPVNIVDLNNDSVFDIVSQCQDGTIYSFNGGDFSNMWTFTDFNSICESSISSAVGNFTGDIIPDVFAVLNRGVAPSYNDHYQVLIDGATGQVVWSDSIGDIHFSSPVAFDYNLDGRDDALISVNNFNNQLNYYNHELFLLDFQNDTFFSILSPAAGINLTSTPYIGDLDNDSLLDIIYSFRVDSINPFNPVGININRINTSFSVPPVGISWGSYMGTNYDGHYNYNGYNCTPFNFSTQIDINSCVELGEGSIVVNVSPSIYSPYTYLWSNGSIDSSIYNLDPGSYFLRITDSRGCIEDRVLTLNAPYFIYTQELISNQCAGDSIAQVQVASNGCVCMFSNCQFYWMSGLDTLSNNHILDSVGSGFYEYVIIHTDGCLITDSVFVADGDSVISNYDFNSISCYTENDGSIILYPTDSINTQYLWSNNDTNQSIYNLSQGSYSVVVNNSYCVDSLSFYISEPDSLTLITLTNDLNCYNDSSGQIVIVDFSGGTPNYSCFFTHDLDTLYNGYFNSSMNFSNLDSGNYFFTAYDDNGCYIDTFFNITSPDELMLSIIAPLVPPNNQIQAEVFGGLSPYHYFWNTGDSSQSITPNSNGLHWCVVTDSNSCIADTAFFNVNWIVNSLDESSNNKIIIYPNPTNSKINIYLEEDYSSLYLISQSNKIVYFVEALNKGKNVLDISRLGVVSGVYIVKIVSGNKVYFKKLIVL